MTIHPLFKLLLVVGAYLLGSVPFGLVLSRVVAGVDVRGVGSGNIGATNVTRAAGKLTGILTLLLDAAKAAIPLLITIGLLGPEGSASMVWWVTAVALAAFFGHLFPVWLEFKGGKGVATGLGVFLVLAPWVALAALATFIVVYAATRIVSLGSLSGTVVCAAGVVVIHGVGNPISWGAVAIGLAIIARHKGNISRLLQRAERKV